MGLSQRELAEIVKMSQQAIAKWETGKAEPDIKMINMLAEFFDVDVNYLFGNTNDSTPPDKNKRPVKTERDICVDRLNEMIDKLSEKEVDKIIDYVDLLILRQKE